MDSMIKAADAIAASSGQRPLWDSVAGISHTGESDDVIAARIDDDENIIELAYWAYDTIKIAKLSNVSAIAPLIGNEERLISYELTDDFEIAVNLVNGRGIAGLYCIDSSDELNRIGKGTDPGIELISIDELDMEDEMFKDMCTDDFVSAIHLS